MEQFTASEVRDRKRFEEWYATHSFNYSRDPIGSRDCSLQWEAWKAARADLLEAREKAVPVGEVVGVAGSYGEMRMIRWRDRYSPAVGTKLYTHPDPSDAERLAEALRWYQAQVADCRKITQEGNNARHALDADGGKRAARALIAHSAQAQPPASSLPFSRAQFRQALMDAGVVKREAIDDSVNYDGGLTRDNVGSSYCALQMFAAQENPNG